MEKIVRSETPDWLAEKWEEWGVAWEEKYQRNQKSSEFSWRQHNGFGKDNLVEKLLLMTHDHCSFCGISRMQVLQPTIEHFRPETVFPRLAYQWENLFISCHKCQEKGDSFDDKLLKPDDEDYDFDTFFDIDWETGKLEPSEVATLEQKARAKYTIEQYKLNDDGRPQARKDELETFQSSSLNLDNPYKWAYRFYLMRGNLIE